MGDNEEMEVQRVSTQKAMQQEEAEKVSEFLDAVEEKKWPEFPQLLALPFRKVPPFIPESKGHPAVYQVNRVLDKMFGSFSSIFHENLCMTENLCRTLFDPSKDTDIFERSGKLIYHMLVVEDEGCPRKYILCSLEDSDAFTRALAKRPSIHGRKIWVVETYGELVQSGKDPWTEPNLSEMTPFIEAMVLKGDMMHLSKYPAAFKAWLGDGAQREQKLEFIERRLEPLDEDMQEFKQRFLALVKSKV